MFSIRSLLLAGVILAIIPYIFWRPYLGILAWTWISIMNPHRMTWGAMREAPVAMIIALVTMLSFAVSREPKRFPMTFLSGVLLLFTFWMCVTTFFAMVPSEAIPKWDKAMKVMIGTFLTLMLMYTRERLNLLMYVVVGSIGFFSIKGGFFSIVTGGHYMVWGPPNSALASNNDLALATIMTIPLMRYLQMNAEKWWLRYGLMIAIALSIISVVGSYSRGAFLALAAMLFVLILKSERRGILLVAAFLGAGLALTIVPDKWYDRMHSISTYEEDGSAQGRFQAWRFAYAIAMESPFVGGGFLVGTNSKLFRALVPEADEARAAHSIYFEVLGEHGFVGLVIFLVLGAGALLTGSWIISRTRGRPQLAWAGNLAAMLQVSMVGYAVGGAFLSQAIFDLYYILIVLMIQTQVIVSKELATERAALKESYLKTTSHARKMPPLPPRARGRPAVAPSKPLDPSLKES